MTCNTTINCVEYLLRQGVKLSDIRISTPSIALENYVHQFPKLEEMLHVKRTYPSLLQKTCSLNFVML